jgi:hypothetical protein
MRATPFFLIGKIACGAFSDSSFAIAGKRRDFCRLLRGD